MFVLGLKVRVCVVFYVDVNEKSLISVRIVSVLTAGTNT